MFTSNVDVILFDVRLSIKNPYKCLSNRCTLIESIVVNWSNSLIFFQLVHKIAVDSLFFQL